MEQQTLSVEEKFTRLISISEECETPDRLVELINTGKKFTAYNGFEPSGRIHIAQALITVMNTNEIISCGGTMIIYIADLFAKMNKKMDSDLDKIKDVGLYFIEVFKACGINMSETKFIWSSDLFNKNPEKYFTRLLDISEQTSLSRSKRCCQIMGRKEGDELSVSQIIYPCMQVADIFELEPEGIDICQLGVDQRKVNMLALEYAKKNGLKVPIILSHHMLMGLGGPKNKMSKSDPKSAIFMEDSYEEIKEKILRAFCTDDTKDNPIFEYIKYILFRWYGKLELCGKNYNNMDEIEKDFHDMNKRELKNNVAEYINKIIEPVRIHFQQPHLKDLLEKVSSYRVTK
ncbi:tyrosyl-tRNA synthetase [Moumouvirus australiensis]|uniref:tyrosine--tRNA ligase n=1 Tax=Moumouvirus australiensis TaxID=2109587 RepID=A0A2P1EMS8_9VIRU|nr:tyrosyl-tRNA synthetase [Moumouvirus australiensis]AVL95172.1 tyrosyl-tRNA synthetase [Moumouvirus australiensis]